MSNERLARFNSEYVALVEMLERNGQGDSSGAYLAGLETGIYIALASAVAGEEMLRYTNLKLQAETNPEVRRLRASMRSYITDLVTEIEADRPLNA